MEIECPACASLNEVQKFCGNCGTKLLADGVEIKEIEKEKFSKSTNVRRNKWLVGIAVFLAIWILGGVIFSVFAGKAGVDERYVSGISFVLGLIALWEYVRNKGQATEETEIQ